MPVACRRRARSPPSLHHRQPCGLSAGRHPQRLRCDAPDGDPEPRVSMSLVYVQISEPEVLADSQAVLGADATIAGPSASAVRNGELPTAAVEWLRANFFKTELELGHCLRRPAEGPGACDLSLACGESPSLWGDDSPDAPVMVRWAPPQPCAARSRGLRGIERRRTPLFPPRGAGCRSTRPGSHEESRWRRGRTTRRGWRETAVAVGRRHTSGPRNRPRLSLRRTR